jgi:methyl-accepting chemotaxis protein
MTTSARPNLLPTAAFVSLLVLVLGATGLFTLYYTNTRAIAGVTRVQALDDVLIQSVRARTSFKTQVQEWKNILLRGRNPADFATYRERFEKEESNVRETLLALGHDFPDLDYVSDVRLDIAPLLKEHALLAEKYRAALASFDPSSPDSTFLVDTAARGIDRKLSDDLDALASAFEKASQAEIKALAAESASRYATMRRVTLIIGALAVLVSLWLAFAASRASRA